MEGKQTMDKPVLSLQEAADLLGVHRDTVVRWTRSPHYLPCVKAGSRWLFNREAVLAWVAGRPPADAVQRDGP